MNLLKDNAVDIKKIRQALKNTLGALKDIYTHEAIRENKDLNEALKEFKRDWIEELDHIGGEIH